MNFKISQIATDRSDASLGLYFKDVRQQTRITPEEELELSKRIQQGDKKSEEKLINANLRFVISVAKQYQGKGLDLVDLIQEGNIGLIDSARRYNASKGVKFISYAVWWIRQAIIKAISDKSRTVRIPMNQIICMNKINKATKEFEQSYSRQPSSKELEELTNLDSEKINISLNTNRSVSLESPIKDEDAGCLLDIIPNDTAPTDTETCKDDISYVLNKILDELPYRDQDIIRMHFGINMIPVPIEEIANKFGISGERIRQIIKEVLKYIRNSYKRELKELR